jgi:hypothetical protein
MAIEGIWAATLWNATANQHTRRAAIAMTSS